MYRQLCPILLFISGIWGNALFGADTTKVKKKSPYRNSYFAVPTLGSSPETNFYFGAVGLIDRTPTWDSTARHSVLKTELTYTLNRQFLVQTEINWTDSTQNWIWIGQNAWMRFPENYWGKGFRSANQLELQYDAFRLDLKNALYRRFYKSWHLGILQQFQDLRFRGILKNPESKAGKDLKSNRSSGLGTGLLFDTRSNLLNPCGGERYFLLNALFHTQALGGSSNWLSVEVDARGYHNLSPKSRLAIQLVSQSRFGHIPFRMTSAIGGPMIMRGYYFGRYRDPHLLAGQAEYRLELGKWIGMTVFGSLGQVYREIQELKNGPAYAGGLGLRIKVDQKDNTNMRFDFAITDLGTIGFYVSFGEAF